LVVIVDSSSTIRLAFAFIPMVSSYFTKLVAIIVFGYCYLLTSSYSVAKLDFSLQVTIAHSYSYFAVVGPSKFIIISAFTSIATIASSCSNSFAFSSFIKVD
jgi:hypothetical protein